MTVIRTKYNGWSNYATWNVSLWMNNDEFLYSTMIACVEFINPGENVYEKFINCMMNCDNPETKDGVRWDDPTVNVGEIVEMMMDCYSEEQA